MKFKILLTTILFGSLIIGMLSCSVGGNWAVKIDNETISIDELNRSYYFLNKTNFQLRTNEEVDELARIADSLDPRDPRRPLLIKSNFLEYFIAQKILYKKSKNDSSLDRKELDAALEMAKMQTIAGFYVQKFAEKMTATDAEVEDFYMRNRDRLRRAPLSDELIEQIKRQITHEKAAVAHEEYMRDLMAESRINKEGFREYMQQLNKEQSEESKPE